MKITVHESEFKEIFQYTSTKEKTPNQKNSAGNLQNWQLIFEVIMNEVSEKIFKHSVIVIEVGVSENNYSTHRWGDLLDIPTHKLLQPRRLVCQSRRPFILVMYVTSDDIQAHEQGSFVFEGEILRAVCVPLNVKVVFPVSAFKSNKIFFPQRKTFVRI